MPLSDATGGDEVATVTGPNGEVVFRGPRSLAHLFSGQSSAAPAAAPLAIAPARSAAPAIPTGGAGRQGTVAFWMGKGAPQHVAEGIADRVAAESGFNPTVPGDAGTSVGLYQHHADRKARLMAQPGWQNPAVQHQFAYGEVTGGDSTATKHWNEILAAPDRATAAKLWDRYFERSAGGVGAGGAGGAGAASSRRMPGRFGGMGPSIPTDEGGADAAMPRTRDRLARAVAPAAAPAPEPAAQAVAAPVAAPAPQPMALRPAPVPPAPNIYQGYRQALASILSGRRAPFGSIFG